MIPEQPNLKEFRLAQEHTEFNLAKDATCYALELPNFLSMYESEYLKLPISAMANQGGVSSSLLIGCPLLMEVPGTAWLAITEADLETNAAMYLTNPAGSWQGHILESRIAPPQNKNDPRIVGPLPHHTAWRVILIASEPGKLIESNVITSLNPESKIQDTSWIHPGKSALGLVEQLRRRERQNRLHHRQHEAALSTSPRSQASRIHARRRWLVRRRMGRCRHHQNERQNRHPRHSSNTQREKT